MGKVGVAAGKLEPDPTTRRLRKLVKRLRKR